MSTKDFVANAERHPNAQNKNPGLAFNNNREQIISAFEDALRHDLIVRSKRLLNEMYTFVYRNDLVNMLLGVLFVIGVITALIIMTLYLSYSEHKIS